MTAVVEDIDERIHINDLIFKLPAENQASQSRTLKRLQPDRQSFTMTDSSKDHITFILEMGDQFIDFKNSYLKFDHQNTGGGLYTWGIGSAKNLFKEIVVYHKNGLELTRLRYANIYNAHRDRRIMTAKEIKTTGGLMGYTTDFITRSIAEASINTYIIPLAGLVDIFNTKELFPSMLAKDLRLELHLEKPVIAMYSTSAITSYTINNIDMVLDVHTIKPQILKELKVKSASKGLELTYNGVNSLMDSIASGVLTTNVLTSRALSQVNSGFAIYRLNSALSAFNADSMMSDYVSDMDESQWRLGSVYFPESKITDRTERYWNLLHVNQQFDEKHPPMSITPTRFIDISAGFESANVDFRTNQDMLSGQPSNNSQVVNLYLKFLSMPSGRVINMFVDHTIICKIFNNNAIRLT